MEASPATRTQDGDKKSKTPQKLAPLEKYIKRGKKAFRKVADVLRDAWQSDAKVTAELMTPAELLAASQCVQKAHRYNVLGDGYYPLTKKYTKDDSLLGSGGYGKVYEVKEIQTGKVYACKEINKAKLFKKGEERTMKAEIEVMRRLKASRFALTMYDVLEDPTNLYIIIELCWGSDVLDTVLAHFEGKGSFSEADAASIMRGMLRAVKSCHDRGVIHRDVKPDNFLWEKEGGTGVLKIADFGLSIFWNPEMKPLQDTCGTPLYMAPETWKKKPYTTEADVWGLGISLALLLTGQHPFDGDTPQELTRSICEDEINMLVKPWADLSPDACNLVSRMLEKDASKRITIDEALKHRWLIEGGTARTVSLTGSVRSGVQKIINMNDLHEAILILMAKKAMKGRELPSLQKQFQECDIDGDGMISLEDMRHNMRRRGSSTSAEDANKLVERLASNSIDGSHEGSSGGGMLSFEQFVVGEIHFRAQVDSESRMKKAFSLLDTDRDQFISQKDLQQAMADAGLTVSQGIERIFKQLDSDGDGRISFEEFSSFWETNVKEDMVGGGKVKPKRAVSATLQNKNNVPVREAWYYDGTETAEGVVKRGALLKQIRGINFVTAVSRRNRFKTPWVFTELEP